MARRRSPERKKKETGVDVERSNDPTVISAQTAEESDPILTLALAAGLFLRLALINSKLADIIASRIEVSTPVTSFKRLKEGLFLFENGIPPYQGGIFHQAPILLAIFHIVPEMLTPYLFVILDTLTASFLIQIARFKRANQSREIWPENGGERLNEAEDDDQKESADQIVNRTGNRDKMDGVSAEMVTDKGNADKVDETKPVDSLLAPLVVGIAYLLNPYSIASCVAKSSLGFNSFAIAAGIFYATRGRKNLSILFIALASYLSIYPLMLLAPCVLLIAEVNKQRIFTVATSSLFLWGAYTVSLLWLSFILVGDWDFLQSTYGVM
ncbi:hypothetical protein HDU76_001493 [Blyttiomyces sp. JEL0837]|nr:hypothetical protein HDU76_001493 [Blyttiomyces sp. JEL0837]